MTTSRREDRPACVVVRARANPGMADEVRRELMAIAGFVRANPDCLDYRVYQDRDDPDRFVFWERWVTAAAGEANLARAYMQPYLARCDALYAERAWEIYDEVHPVGEAS